MSCITEHFHDVVIVIRILLVFFFNPKKILEFLTLGGDNQRPPLPSQRKYLLILYLL
jgi:hypothetical protein